MIHLSQWFTTFFLLNKPEECSIAPSVTMALHSSDSAVTFSKIGACVLGEGEGSILKKILQVIWICLHLTSSFSSGIGCGEVRRSEMRRIHTSRHRHTSVLISVCLLVRLAVHICIREENCISFTCSEFGNQGHSF